MRGWQDVVGVGVIHFAILQSQKENLGPLIER
jgi:hypothetical protein